MVRSNPTIDVRLKRRNELRHHRLVICWYFIVLEMANQFLPWIIAIRLREDERASDLSWGAVSIATTMAGRPINIGIYKVAARPVVAPNRLEALARWVFWYFIVAAAVDLFKAADHHSPLGAEWE